MRITVSTESQELRHTTARPLQTELLAPFLEPPAKRQENSPKTEEVEPPRVLETLAIDDIIIDGICGVY